MPVWTGTANLALNISSLDKLIVVVLVGSLVLIDIRMLILQILTGHQSNAEYALAMCNYEALVLSGGYS
ncbi:hypothetical protein BHE74_00000697 [Ensete ventricosum]|nr:hypothetical protein GW17_00000553 [Ensete ventricosum]RWW90163.1 hypothetical protein BHE74_00000697 [Ensete ventricosum]RZR76500.1 hypothetical protein BHM03_00001314 [Ensete ventricosum]